MCVVKVVGTHLVLIVSFIQNFKFGLECFIVDVLSNVKKTNKSGYGVEDEEGEGEVEGCIPMMFSFNPSSAAFLSTFVAISISPKVSNINNFFFKLLSLSIKGGFCLPKSCGTKE
jgi:hypothetical protein